MKRYNRPCEVVEAAFVWGPQRCGKPHTGYAQDAAHGTWHPVCADHGRHADPYRPRWRVTRRGYGVLRIMSALVTITVCSMTLAALVAILLAWFFDAKPWW